MALVFCREIRRPGRGAVDRGLPVLVLTVERSTVSDADAGEDPGAVALVDLVLGRLENAEAEVGGEVGRRGGG